MIKELQVQRQRLLDALTQHPCDSEEYGRVLSYVLDIDRYIGWIEDGRDGVVAELEPEETSSCSEGCCEVVYEEPVETKPAKAKPAKKESKGPLTKEMVRTALIEARDRGVNIKNILMEFIPSGSEPKFSNLPETCYEEVMKLLTED